MEAVTDVLAQFLWKIANLLARFLGDEQLVRHFGSVLDERE